MTDATVDVSLPAAESALPELRDYTIHRLLSKTRTGPWYVATYRPTGHIVAVQVINPEFVADQGTLSKLAEVGERISRLHHRNIVGVYNLVQENAKSYLVSELITALPLRHMLQRKISLSPAACVALIDDTLAALEVAHGGGVIHGDIHPGVVLITPEGRAKLGGFVTSLLLPPVETMSAKRLSYMSPEQRAGNPPEVRDDLYAVATIGRELVSNEAYASGRGKRSGSMPALLPTLERARTPRPDDRIGSAHTFRRSLLDMTARRLGVSWRDSSDLGQRVHECAELFPPPVVETRNTQADEQSKATDEGEKMGSVPENDPSNTGDNTSGINVHEEKSTAAETATPKRRHWWRWIAGGLVVLIAVVAVAAVTVGKPLVDTIRNTGPLSLSNVNLTMSPTQAGCDATFHFTATGDVSGVGTLIYRWEQSDGKTSASQSVPITSKDGSFLFTQSWRLQGSQPSRNTMTFHILQPSAIQAKQSFGYSCP